VIRGELVRCPRTFKTPTGALTIRRRTSTDPSPSGRAKGGEDGVARNDLGLAISREETSAFPGGEKKKAGPLGIRPIFSGRVGWGRTMVYPAKLGAEGIPSNMVGKGAEERKAGSRLDFSRPRRIKPTKRRAFAFPGARPFCFSQAADNVCSAAFQGTRSSNSYSFSPCSGRRWVRRAEAEGRTFASSVL